MNNPKSAINNPNHKFSLIAKYATISAFSSTQKAGFGINKKVTKQKNCCDNKKSYDINRHWHNLTVHNP